MGNVIDMQDGHSTKQQSTVRQTVIGCRLSDAKEFDA